MGLFDVMKKAGNVLVENVGLEHPNTLCTEQYKCHDCGLIWYLPKSIISGSKVIIASPGHECTKGDGKHHWMLKVR